MARRPPRTLLSRPRAAAVRYREEFPFRDTAPRLVAKGEGLLAERIVAEAKKHGIPIEHDPDLMAALAPLDINRLIPPALFRAMALVLATLYKANRAAHPLSPSSSGWLLPGRPKT
jgi:flagellar biosynthesis protein